MANQVFANMMEVSCKAANGKSIAAFPDVCFTPPQTPATPPGVPIPYPNTGMASDTTKGSRSVKISGKEVMLKNKSYFKTSYGDEPGCAPKKGVITSKNKGKVYFQKWSMNVMVEGENVVRMMDLTTHNHGSQCGNTAPWPYTDAIAMDVDGHPCQGMAHDIKGKCTGPKDYSSACCDSRKCLLVPYAPNTCCDGPDGEQMTPHHLLPAKEFVAHANRGKLDPTTNYDAKKAPCICLQGTSHHKGTEHGDVGCNYTAEKNKWYKNPKNEGKPYTLADGTKVGASSAEGKVRKKKGAKGCDEDCIERQLADEHEKMNLSVKKNDPLPRAKQPKTYTLD